VRRFENLIGDLLNKLNALGYYVIEKKSFMMQVLDALHKL